MSRPIKKSLYIDALALVPERKSGVGLTISKTLEKLASLEELKDWQIYLVVPLGKSGRLKSYLRTNVKVKVIWLPARAIELLMRTRLLPPVDWFLGQGIYIFPNYRNWPVWKSRSLTYIYDTSFIKYPHTVQVKNQKYLTRYINLWTGRTDKIITISEQVKSEIEQCLGIYYAKIDVVPCGVDGDVFSPQPGKIIRNAKERYSIPYDRYLLYVGNIEPRKNLVSLLEAYRQLPAGLRDKYGLVIVGGGGWLNEEFYAQLTSMQTDGYRVMKVEKFVKDEDLPSIYSGASLLVHPAIYEGFGITPLEAMACGTPVAVSDLPVIKEVVGAAGTYFDPNNSQSIASAIKEALRDDTAGSQKIESGLQKAKESGWQETAAILYQSVEAELRHGLHAHPVLDRLKAFYRRADRLVMRLLGQKNLEAYRPAHADDMLELRLRLYDDFADELPSRMRTFGLKIYLATKHAAGQLVRAIYYGMKRGV